MSIKCVGGPDSSTWCEFPAVSGGREDVEPYLGLQLSLLCLQVGERFLSLLQLTLQGGHFPFSQDLLLSRDGQIPNHTWEKCKDKRDRESVGPVMDRMCTHHHHKFIRGSPNPQGDRTFGR